ncbi:RmuC domain protein [Bacteriovorax sp. DB6_IX]|nr:RmuC domain protein [Bacteriovorax sp. DB6_IX]
MTTIQLIIVLVFQIAVIGLIVFFRKMDRSEKDGDRSAQDLSNLIQNQGQGLSDTLIRNNDQLSKNFGELREGVLERLLESKAAMNKDLYEFKDLLTKDLEVKFDKLNGTIQEKMDRINNKVQENLNEGFKKTNETFTGIIQRLAKIDEAQKKIESLSTNVISLQDVLTDKKSRGIFGEVQLNNLLQSVFGEPGKYYHIQHKVKDGRLADAALTLPDPIGLLCVDSKFPLENFKRMFEGHTEEEKKLARREFVKNLKKHIDDISSKYIIPNETADQAIMFLPAEAIFAEIHAYHPDIVEYSQQKRVWIASPTTFMATLTTVQSVIMNMERSKYMSILHREINKLGDEFARYETRWNDLSKHLGTVTKDVDKINVTTTKITKQFQKIMEVEVEQTPESIDFSGQGSLN